MNFRSIGAGAALALSALVWTSAGATPILCKNPSLNHTFVDSAFVSSCVDAGTGNINGNPKTDAFLASNADLDYTGIGSGTFTQKGDSGTFGLSSSLWDEWSSIAVGLKFGTGNKPDAWFVYLLHPGVTAGYWEFYNKFDRGGGLSHVQLYGVQRGSTKVPEPASLALVSLGALGLALARRRKRA
jgi:hypothetical protein